MKIDEQISVTITKGRYAGRTLRLDVVDFLPYEPSNYVWTPGWDCMVEIAGEVVWFFVDEGGAVWGVDYDTFQVGICPEQEEIYKQRLQAEELVEENYRERELCACGDPADCGGVH